MHTYASVWNRATRRRRHRHSQFRYERRCVRFARRRIRRHRLISTRARTGCRHPSACANSVRRDIAAPRVSSARVESIFKKHLSVRVLDNPPLPRHGRPQILGKQTVSAVFGYFFFIIVYTMDIGFLTQVQSTRIDRLGRSADQSDRSGSVETACTSNIGIYTYLALVSLPARVRPLNYHFLQTSSRPVLPNNRIPLFLWLAVTASRSVWTTESFEYIACVCRSDHILCSRRSRVLWQNRLVIQNDKLRYVMCVC